MEERKLYKFTNSQDVVRLQCKYTLFKRVMNICMGAITDEPFDFDLMKKALNKVIERMDCLRIRFVKKDGELMQYFIDLHK